MKLGVPTPDDIKSCMIPLYKYSDVFIAANNNPISFQHVSYTYTEMNATNENKPRVLNLI